MVLITRQMGFAWANHPSRACPTLDPDGHAPIKTNHPRGDEKFCHIFLPLENHLTYLPKLIGISWGWISSVPKLMCDLIKLTLGHDVVELVGAGVGSMVVLIGVPEGSFGPATARGHEKLEAKIL